jgi:UDP-4-amino-4,6-dideoxy-N-acetyl-beta-L-altrosamine N-acetyltransferase
MTEPTTASTQSDAMGRVRPLASGDLMRLFAWRNHPQVRAHMFSPDEIALDAHRRWFEASLVDPRRRLFIYEAADAAPAGFVGFTLQGAHPRVADWGFYSAPEAPRGTGRAMARCALDAAFGALGLHKVCGQALETNARSIDFHRRLGFADEGLLREQHWDGTRFVDVRCFGLLAREWRPTSRAQ